MLVNEDYHLRIGIQAYSYTAAVKLPSFHLSFYYIKSYSKYNTTVENQRYIITD